MRHAAWLTALAPLAAVLASPPAEAQSLDIPYTRSTLGNGLTVIYHVDHTLPVTVVDVSYDVGSRFEAPKRTGFAHLFEHLMFMGTRRVPPKMFDAWMEGAGGWNNAFTTEDRTNYYDVAPPTALPLLLWMEADRLRDIGPLMSLEKLNLQREVVKNERRQTSENTPYGAAELRIPELLYPAENPYHHPVIGSHEDLEAASVDDVKQFFATYYDPSNAVLVVGGDFDPEAVRPQIEKELGSIATHGKPKDPGAPGFDDTKTTLTSVVRETLKDDVELAKVYLAWQSPKHYAAGDAELGLLASVLTSGKASRLYQSLVYEQKLAQSVESIQESRFLGSSFYVALTARPGVTLAKLEAAVDVELEKIRRAPVKDDELTRAKNLSETGLVSSLQSVRERAGLLARYQEQLGDPGYLPKDLERYRKVTPADVMAAANKYLKLDARVIVRVLPKEAK